MRTTLPVLWLIGVVCAAGCGPTAEKMVPVHGKLTVESEPLTSGVLGFLPDASRGNDRGQSSLGQIQADGSYDLETAGKPGVPPGWYKVLVWSTNDPAAGGNPWGPDGRPRKIAWLTHSKYTAIATTDLIVEVVEEPPPGRYDFKLAR